MPAKLDRCVESLKEKGYSESSAYAICNASIDEMFQDEEQIDAEYEGREVTLNKPFRTPGESKKFAVYVQGENGVQIVRFGDPDMEIKRDDPEAREAFRSRHNCAEKKDRTSPGYWSCKMWSSDPVSNIIGDSFVSDAAMNERITEKHLDKDTGFLTMKATVSRVGIQDYYGIELGSEFEPYKVYKVFRPPEEVFSEDSLKSFINCPATDEHPSEMVTVDNVSRYMKGSISTASVDGDHVTSTMTITDKELINKIMNGKTELSVGYTHDLEIQEGS